MSRYVVIRPAPGADPSLMPEGMDGRWIEMPETMSWDWSSDPDKTVAYATGRFEEREDGVFAEVFEVRP